MRRLTSSAFQSLDGYDKGPNEDVSWNEAGEAYLTGTIVELEPSHHWLLELADPSWPRPAAGREVIYGFTLTETGDVVRIVSESAILPSTPRARGDVTATLQAGSSSASPHWRPVNRPGNSGGLLV